jgi:hypothetical protein
VQESTLIEQHECLRKELLTKYLGECDRSGVCAYIMSVHIFLLIFLNLNFNEIKIYSNYQINKKTRKVTSYTERPSNFRRSPRRLKKKKSLTTCEDDDVIVVVVENDESV